MAKTRGGYQAEEPTGSGVESNLHLINLESALRIIITLSALAETELHEDTRTRILKEIARTAKEAMSE